VSREITAGVCYFGKVPSRGDFVRAADNHQLLGWLDRWAGQSVELLSQNPDWKRLYDEAPDIYYGFLGSRSRTVICGHFQPSRDSSQRRFPLLSAVRLEVSDPLAFIGRSPLALSKVWAGLSRLAVQAVTDVDATGALGDMVAARYTLKPDPVAYNATFNDFLEMQTICTLERLFADSGHGVVCLRQVLPALGMLLQPVLAGGNVAIDKALHFPLVRDPLYRPLVAAFWLDIVASFLGRGDFELGVLMRNDVAPYMVVGFGGADHRALRAVLDPREADDFLIRVDQAEWVDEYLQGDYNLNRLAGYLGRDELALRTACRLFGETFLGT
jgi:type VI secretion system protein ImpM